MVSCLHCSGFLKAQQFALQILCGLLKVELCVKIEAKAFGFS